MKKMIIVLTALIGLSIPISADNVVITGISTAMPDKAIADIIRFDGNLGETIATDTVTDGKFQVTLHTDSSLNKLALYIRKDNKSSRGRRLYVRPGAKIEIIGEDEHVDTWKVKSNVPEQAEYDKYLMESKDILDSLHQIDIEYDRKRKTVIDEATVSKVKEEYTATKSLRDSLYNITLLRDLELMKGSEVTEVWLDKMEAIASTCGSQTNNSICQSIKELYGGLSDSIKTSKQGLKIKSLLYPPKKIEKGDWFPTTQFRDLTGEVHTMQELRGKWVIVVFWSAGCGGCHYAFQELPKLLSMHLENLEGVLLSCDSDKWWRWATENFAVKGNNWNEGMEDYGLYKSFGNEGLPTVVMVTPEGRVADIFIGFYEDRIEDNLRK